MAIERNGANGMSTTERIGANILGSVEKNAGEARLTTVVTDAASREAAAGQARDISVAIERNGSNGMSTTERNASILLSAIDKNAGEARLTTVVTDAASREAAANHARDVTSSVERNGSALSSAVERNGGDTRTAVVQQEGETRAAIYNIRKDIVDSLNVGNSSNLNSLNRSTNEIMGAIAGNSADIKSGINNSAWETRNMISTNFAALALEQHRSKDYLSAQASQNFGSLQLEQQKAKEILTLQIQDSKFEALKNQQALAAQLAQSTNQISTQQAAATADAKYEALKNQQLLSAQMMECCCEIKSRVDQRAMDVTNVVNTLDTNRLRDNWVTARDEVNIYRVFDRFDRDRDRGFRGDRGDDRGGRGGRD
jgi:hypothetical protein